MQKKIEIIFELGHNFHGNIRFARKMLDSVRRCGGTLAKVQLYDVDRIMAPDNPVYPELQMGQINYKELRNLKEYADEIGIELFASVFDVRRVGWCERLHMQRYKLASRSIYDQRTIKAMEATGKPIIASLGMLNEEGIIPAIKNATYLYCVAEYPAVITTKEFPVKFDQELVGFSDHTVGMDWAREAVRRGATIIEKHFTLDKRLPGCDQAGSADPFEMSEFLLWCREYEKEQ